jgi:hypothetical protein
MEDEIMNPDKSGFIMTENLIGGADGIRTNCLMHAN